MLTMDVFKQDAFSSTSLTAAVDKVGYVPGFLGSYPGLFEPAPVRTEAIWIESRGTDAALIQTSPRGSPPKQKGGDLRDARPFKTSRLALGSRINSSELAFIREFGSETEVRQLQTEIARRQFKLKRDHDLTLENMRLGCVQGLTADADGTTLYNWATEFGQTIPAEVDFDLDNASPAAGILRTRCTAAVRSVTRGLKGLGGNGVRVVSICGDDFWDLLIAHSEVRATYLNYQAAAALRDPVAWETFNFGGITWTNYRGTDDGSTVAVGASKAKFFPAGAGIFQWAQSPGERFADIGTVGQPFYSAIVVDQQRDAWADVEVMSYPLMVCTMPQALYRAKMT
jgi:hypothetical protein